ncbi:Ndufa5, NADH-ubiquinone oxidoreductase subunit [Armillaria solidipes]|uniref:Ndufa5, NADH-ubiquinone oxidoreductase subunit n=1 Tax=Armillaria solidipes TaxID=1076256 RepID=A0A2H3C2D8_9AGAR|nr:Ndufa5, NADH-ubiquinone oxidoreductase subunit [Armillaria solidipes]
MFRCSRPLFNVVKRTTGVTGLKVHPNPLPVLAETYRQTLEVLASVPSTSVYKQSAEALTLHKIKVLEAAKGDIASVEKGLDEGQIEESLNIASDELRLASQMIEWKAWEPLEEKPERGQWEYFGQTTSS